MPYLTRTILLIFVVLFIAQNLTQGQDRKRGRTQKKPPTASSKPTTVESIKKSNTIPVLVIIKARAGDTPSKIATRYNLPVDVVAKLNRVGLDTKLRVGQEIKLPFHAPPPLTTGLSARSIPTDIKEINEFSTQVINHAEARFKEGEIYLKANRRLQAREKFDKAVDSILESGLDIRASQKLQTYYLDLVERIYRLEVPQQVASRIELGSNSLAIFSGQYQQDDKNAPREPGFKHQKFEASPLDPFSSSEESLGKCYVRNVQVRGLHLGMNINEVKKILLNLNDVPADKLGYKNLLFIANPRTGPQPIVKGDIRGITRIILDFLDNKLMMIRLFYDDSTTWTSTEEFVARISEALNLSGSWRSVLPNVAGFYRDRAIKRLVCSDIRFDAGLYGKPIVIPDDKKSVTSFLEIQDITSEIELNKRRRAEEERKQQEKLRKEEERRKTFRP